MQTLMWTLLTLFAPIFWGSTYIVTSEVLPADIPFTVAVIRCLPAGLILILMSRYIPKKHEWGKLLILSMCNFTCFQALLFIAAYRLPGGLAAVLGAIQPLAVLGLSWLVLSQKPCWLSTTGCASAVLGMALLILTPMIGSDVRWDSVGMVAALLGAFSMGLGTFLSKHWQGTALEIPLFAFTGWQLLLGGLMLIPMSLAWDPQLPALTTEHIAGFVYLGVMGTLVAYLIWFNGVSKLSSTAVSALGLMSPVSAVVLGWVVLDQSITGWAFVGLVIVIASVLVVQWSYSIGNKQQTIQPINENKEEKAA